MDNENNLIFGSGGLTTATAITTTGSSWGSITAVPQWSVNDVSREKVTLLRKVKLLGITISKKLVEIPVDKFFDRMKKDKLKIQIIDKIVDKYMASIERAELAGQTALVEKLKDGLEVVKMETKICILGVSDYLTKGQVESLLDKTSKHIAITPIRNYTKFIPDEIVKKVAKLKKENLFSDFVVMHYDPKKENVQKTKKEIEKEKDPIIFGKIQGSDNFYFIADWVDEYCNLTLKEALVTINDKAKNLLK